MEEYSRKMAGGVQMEVPDQLLGHGLEVAMRQRKQAQPRCQDQHAFSALDQRHHPQSSFWRGIGHGFAPSSRFRRLYRPTLLGNDLRRVHQVLGEKPYLEFIGSNDATHEQVVRAVIAKGGFFPQSDQSVPSAPHGVCRTTGAVDKTWRQQLANDASYTGRGASGCPLEAGSTAQHLPGKPSRLNRLAV